MSRAPLRTSCSPSALTGSSLAARARAATAAPDDPPNLDQQLGGYLHTEMLDPGLKRHLVAPGLGDEAGVLGAITMAQDNLDQAPGS